MRSERVVTNLTCSQNCVYCDRRAPADEPAFVTPAAVRQRIALALASGPDELTLTGGEPLLRRDLTALVATAAAGASVILETNGALIDDERARELRRAGVSRVRVNLSGFGPALDAVTRDEGGFARTLAGLRALLRAGIATEVTVVLVAETLPLLDAFPERLAGALGAEATSLRGLVVHTPVDGPSGAGLLTLPAAAQAIEALARSAKRVGLLLRIAPESAVPPCVFPAGTLPAHAFGLSRGGGHRAGFEHVAACTSCLVQPSCPGLPSAYLAREALPPMAPVEEERARRRLTVMADVETQRARELVTRNRSGTAATGVIEEDVIRVNFHCNQSCRFCFVSTHLPPETTARVREAIVSAGARGAKVTLSGGEPTLNPDLLAHVALARSVSPHPVQLQTNAVQLDDAEVVHALERAGLGEAFVSLHGSTADISDAVTQSPGTFARTVVGIDNLVASSIVTVVNFVICRRNHRDLPAFVRLVATRWPGTVITVSFVALSTDVVPRDRELVPRYTDVRPYLDEAMQLGKELGVRLTGFDSMCGMPLCLAPASIASKWLLEVPAGFDGGEFVRAEACNGCRYERSCYGLRRGYAELYGTGELERVERERVTHDL